MRVKANLHEQCPIATQPLWLPNASMTFTCQWLVDDIVTACLGILDF